MKKINFSRIISCILIGVIFIAQFSIIFPMFVGADDDNDDNDKDKKPKKPKKVKRNVLFMNWEDSIIFGNDLGVAGVEYSLQWFSGGVWIEFQSGITGSDGIISIDYPDVSAGWYEGREYQIVFSGEYSRLGIITQPLDNYVSEIEVPIIASIDITVQMDDLTFADDILVEL